MMKNEIAAFKRYKKAKLIVSELEAVIKIMNLTIRGLSMYVKYVPVYETLIILRESKTLLDIQRKKYKVIVDNKGEE